LMGFVEDFVDIGCIASICFSCIDFMAMRRSAATLPHQITLHPAGSPLSSRLHSCQCSP
jgi:hypothetical protein